MDFILPRLCQSCSRRLLSDENVVCQCCLEQLSRVSEATLCREYGRKFEHSGLVSGMYSLYAFEMDKPIRNVIHSLKYGLRWKNGLFLGSQIALNAGELIKQWQADMIMPVPLHRLKQAERGYNQSYYIALGLSGSTGVPLLKGTLKRRRFTLTQTHLSIDERRDNVRDAFFISRRKHHLIENKAIILVDDVITTGATINECARILLISGAKRVYAISAALA